MAGTLDLGELYAKLSVNYSDLHLAELEARKFAQNTRNQFDSIAKAGQKLAGTGKALTAGVTAPIVGIGAVAFQAARDFSNAFSDVEKNIGDLNASNIGAFKQQILDLGRDSMLGAEGLAALVSEGGKLGEASAGALEFAKAAEMMAIAFDFGKTKEAAEQAGDIIGGLRSSFGYTTKEVLELADSINFFADSTAAGAQSVTRILQAQGATVANVTNLSKGELAALAASFDSVAPSTEIAATGMKNFILSLAAGDAATEQQAAMFEKLGFSAKGMAKMLQKDAAGAITKVLKALGNVDEAEKAAVTMTLFGKESIGAISPLIKNLAMVEDSFKKAGDSSKSLGSVKKEYDRLNDSDDAKITKAMNALNVAMIQIGAEILPIVGDMASQFSKFISDLGPLDPELVKIGLTLGVVAAAIGPVLFAVGSAVAAIAPLIASAGGLSAALASLAAMAGPVGLAIAAIIAAGILLYKHWDQVKAFVIGLVNSVVSWFRKWASENSELLGEIKAAWNALLASGKALWDTLYNIISTFVADTIASLDELLAPIGGIQGAWELLKTVAGEALTAIGTWLRDFLATAKEVFDAVNAWLKDGNAWDTFKNLVRDVTEAIVSYFLELPAKLTQLKAEFVRIFNEIVAYLKSIDWRKLGADIIEGLKQGIINAKDSAVNAVKEVGNAVIEGANSAFDRHSPSKVFMDIGKDLMLGLGLGVSANTMAAVNAVVLASDTMIGAVKEKLSAEEMQKQLKEHLSSGVNDLNKSVTLDGQDQNFELQLAKEQAYYDKSLALLKQAEELKIASIRPYNDLREQMEAQHTSKMIGIYRDMIASTRQSLDATLTSLKEFGAEQSGIYKAIFAVSKAFAIADAVLAMSQNVANASKVGFPYNIPFIAGAVAQGASIIANVQAISGQFNNGGYIAAGQVGLVGETGRPELVSGPANVLSSQRTHELMNGGGSGGGSPNITVEVHNYGNSNVEVEQSGNGEEKRLRILIDRVKDSIASDAIRGDGKVDTAFAQAFGMSRAS